MRRRILSATVLAIVAMALMALPVLAIVYRATYTVTEDGTAAYDMLGVVRASPNQWMADNGFMNASANDTRIETLGGLEKPHMVTENMTMTAVPVPLNSVVNLYFTTGGSELDSFQIIPGYGGYVTVDDSPWLEPGDNFSATINGWIDTSVNTAPSVVATNSSNQTASDTNHTVDLPSSIEAGDLLMAYFTVYRANGNPVITFPAGWTQLFVKDNVRLNAGAWYHSANGTEGASITVTTSIAAQSAHLTYRITNYTGVPEAGTATTGLNNNPDPPNFAPSWGARLNLWFAFAAHTEENYITAYPASYTGGIKNRTGLVNGQGVGGATRELEATAENPGTFTFCGNPERWVANTIAITNSKNLIRKTDALTLYISGSGNITAQIEGTSANVTATGVSSGVHAVTVTANTTHLWIDIDTVTENTTALSGASVPSNAELWAFFEKNVVPYSDNITLSVNGTMQLWLQPRSMIIGTNLPDRATSATNNGTFVWGGNPAGVTVALGSLVSGTQPTPGVGADRPTQDILPEVEVTDWFIEPDVGGTLETHPLRPFVTLMSDTTTLTELLAWRLLGLAFCLFVTVLTAKNVRGHQAITGFVAGAAIGVMVQQTIFPMWALGAIIVCILGGLTMERTSSL